MQLIKLQLVKIKINVDVVVHPCLNESLCKTIKWHRVPVLTHRWWISVHHVEQAMIIQLTSRSSHSGIAQEMFWDIWNRTELVAMKPSTVNLSCCLLEQVSFLLFRLFCAAVLNCATDRGLWSISIKLQILFAFIRPAVQTSCL